MIKLTRDSEIDFLKYQDYIQATGYIYIDPDGIENVLAFEDVRKETLSRLAVREMNANGGLQYTNIAPSTVKEYLKRVHHLTSDDIKENKKGNESLNADILTSIKDRGIAEQFLEYFMEFNSVKSRLDKLDKIPDRLLDHGEIGAHGTPIMRLPYHVSRQRNNRYYYKDSDIIGLPRAFYPRFSVPEGYFMVWGDMPQSDLKFAVNMLVMTEENEHYFEGSSDWYLSVYNLLCDFHGRERNLDEFKETREDMKASILSAIYGADKGKTPAQDVIVRDFNAYLATCPKYVEFRRRIEVYADKGYPIVSESYFRTVDIVTPSSARNGGKVNVNSLRNAALNAPFQKGTSEVVIQIVSYIMDKFRELGYGDDDIRVYIVRHDEPIFMVSNKLIEHMWIFEDATKVIIGNWKPFDLYFEYGYKYLQVDEKLTEEVNGSIARNIEKCNLAIPDVNETTFLPIKEIQELYVGKHPLPNGKLMVVIIDPSRDCYYPVITNSEGDEIEGEFVEIGHVMAMAKILSNPEVSYIKNEVSMFLLKNSSDTMQEVLDNGVMMNLEQTSQEGGISDTLALIQADIYCKREGISNFITEEEKASIEANEILRQRYSYIAEL